MTQETEREALLRAWNPQNYPEMGEPPELFVQGWQARARVGKGEVEKPIAPTSEWHRFTEWENEFWLNYGRYPRQFEVWQAALAHTQQWWGIESAPKDGQVVIVGWPDGACHIGKYSSGDFWFQSTRGNHLCNKMGFTHWMPLPMSPTAESGSKPSIHTTQAKPVEVGELASLFNDFHIQGSSFKDDAEIFLSRYNVTEK